MESLRIGMFSWESLYSVKVGGISPHVSELAETLVAKGHEVHIFTRIGDKSEYDEINGVHYQRCRHDQSGGVVNQMDRMCDAMVDRFDAVQKLFGRFDVIHGHDWHPVLALIRIKKSQGLPLVLTYHSTEWGRNGNKFGNWWEFHEISHREWLGGIESAAVIVTSENLKHEIQFLYKFPDQKLHLIPNGIVAGKIKRAVDPGVIKVRYGIHPLAPVVLFIGRMSYQKGPDLLVEAIPRVLAQRGDVKFVFIGEKELRPFCEHRAAQLGVRNVCWFLGYAPDAVALDWMNACDLVCVPSRNEPFCIVVLEAWDAGKPVIGTEAVHLISNFSTGIKAYIAPDSIAWCINYALANPEQSRSMGEKGNSLIKELYNWDSVADEVVKLYTKTF
ncbi:MAG: glycosyltransferase family 1 protein [Methanophagales archaeon ANME-1-THS]|nr:MAG: glycosyltransferase family 1 protein [Methanophagales archaeon ANME-1-THS]